MIFLEKQLKDIIRREKGFVNNPKDRGGPTKYGITQKTLSKFLGRKAAVQDVKDLSEITAKIIYRHNYYYSPGLQMLPLSLQPFLFDSGVNHGPQRAIKFLQTTCNKTLEEKILEDGICGPKTLDAVVKTYFEGDKTQFLKDLIETRKEYFLAIVEEDKTQEEFLSGWINRLKEFEGEPEPTVAPKIEI